MSYPKHEAPRELVAVLWSIAGIIAVFLAISVSSLFILKTYFPVDADDANTPAATSDKCTGAEIAINNYPGPTNITKYVPGNPQDKTTEAKKPLGGLFQCSSVCIPGLSSGTIDSSTKIKVQEFLEGGTIGGKKVATVTNGEAFMQKWKIWNDEKDASKKQALADELKVTVILSQIKPDCKGPDSTDYAKPILGKAGQEAPITKENTTAKQEDQGKTDTTGTTGARTTSDPAKAVAESAYQAPASGNVNLPVGQSGTEGGGSVKTTSTGSPDLATCTKKVNDFLYKYQQLLNQMNANTELTDAQKKASDPDIRRFTEIREAYLGLKQAPFLGDEEKSYKKCLTIEKLATTMANKLWGTKTQLASCKKNVNDFLVKYPKVTKRDDILTKGEAGDKEFALKGSDTARKLRYEVDSRNYYIKYSPWYWVSAERQLKTCKEALSYIEKYKVAINGTTSHYGDRQESSQIPSDQPGYSQSVVSAAILKDLKDNNRTINYHLSGKVYFNLSNGSVSKKAKICIANTISKSTGSSSGFIPKYAKKDGTFDIDYTVYGSDINDSGIAILFSDSGGLYASSSFLYTTGASQFRDILLNQLLQHPNSYTATATFGNVDLRPGSGKSSAMQAEFKRLTGYICNP